MQQLKNPFYVLLMFVGIVFTVTMCMYCVMTLTLSKVTETEPTGLIAFLAKHGLTMIVAELIAMAVLTVLAIWTDEYFTGEPPKAESNDDEPK